MEKIGVYVVNKFRDKVIYLLSLGFSIVKKEDFRKKKRYNLKK